MEYVTLGKTNLKISRLGFGGIPIQRTTQDEAKKLFKALSEEGINFVDTAKMYTVSEAFIGEAIEGKREDFILATKSMARTKEAMERDIKSSLENLKTDYIDLYQVHNPSMEQLDMVCAGGGALEALKDSVGNGFVGHLGITAHSFEVFKRALSLPWVETIMFPYNIVETQGEELMRECTKRNIGFIAMKPLAGGAIENACLALRFVSQNTDVTAVIPGMHSTDELYSNKAAVENEEILTEKELLEIEEIRKHLGNNFCRRCNYCAPCAAGISIPSVFLFAGYLERYGLEKWAHERYATLNVKAGACIECGICETRCPYKLPIRKMMKKSADEFGE